jgi:hypothetical protein
LLTNTIQKLFVRGNADIKSPFVKTEAIMIGLGEILE